MSKKLLFPFAFLFICTGSLRAQQGNPNNELKIQNWSVTPIFSSLNRAWDVERDASDNVIVFGGTNPMRIIKYTPIGAALWIHTTSYTQSVGDLALDSAGNTYVTAGYDASITKVNAGGSLAYKTTNVPGITYWALAASCKKNAIVLAYSDSTKGGYLAYIDLATGALTNQTKITGVKQDIRAICASPNGNYYLLTSDAGTNERVMGVDKNFGVLFDQPSLHNPSFSNTPLYSAGTQGYNGIAADMSFVYTNDGATLYKRDISNGNSLGSVAIAGGTKDANSGVWVDGCGNIFVGAANAVNKYTSSLVFVTNYNVAGAVYDISGESSTNGELAVCGNAFVASIPTSACAATTCSTTTSINENELDETSIYPNPSNGIFTIKTSNNNEKQISIFDVLGKLVYETTTDTKDVVINTLNTERGIYFVRIISGSEVNTLRITLQ